MIIRHLAKEVAYSLSKFNKHLISKVGSQSRVVMATAATKPIEKSNGPNSTVVQDFMEFASKYEDCCYIEGDVLSFSGLKDKGGLRLVEARAEQLPPYDERDEDLYEEFDAEIKITIHADAKKYKVEGDSKNSLLCAVKKWLSGENGDNMKILSQCIVRSEPAYHEICSRMLVDTYLMSDFIGDIKDSPFYHNVWNKHMNKIITEGVCYARGKVSDDLCKNLTEHIGELAAKTQVDYHPKSNDIVRDLVHPALYPYIKGESKLKKNTKLPENIVNGEGKDFWGRTYERSKFQWLPTTFKITNERKCLIQDYINNLDQVIFSSLYKDLEALFEVFLPFFEEVWSYAKAMEFFQGDSDDPLDEDKVKQFKKEKVVFAGKELQVITKIVDYTLKPDQFYEGVWHAEGMSHENIVMTGIYFLDRDPSIVGGDLRFKRAFSVAERSKVFWNVPQCRPQVVNTFSVEGFIPLGYFPTEQGYLLVFPNCHIHKIAKLINTSKDKAASRRIVVFFMVNPETRIISTSEVPPQQNTISLRRARNYRLELMAERKYDKEKLNVRDIELCEH